MIYQTDHGEWVISSHGCWLPGVYATRKAASYALQFDNEILATLHNRALIEKRTITTNDLRKAAKK